MNSIQVGFGGSLDEIVVADIEGIVAVFSSQSGSPLQFKNAESIPPNTHKKKLAIVREKHVDHRQVVQLETTEFNFVNFDIVFNLLVHV